MRVKVWVAMLCLVTTAGAARAQSTTGTISGRVIDAQGLAVPGVVITASSPNLQGTRETVSSSNGDYILSLLPPGPYTLTFELTGFERQQRAVSVAPTQVLPLEVTMGPATLSETVQVVGRSADVLTKTAQVATNFNQELIANLPTARDLNATLQLAPGVAPTGPTGNYSIAGSVSFENLFMVNGVTINENLRGQAYDLYIEDAIQETVVATGGISAEFGRFSGGMVNMITKSGGNAFTGSFRDTLNNDDWRTLTPFEDRQIASGGRDQRVDKVVPTYEYTFGGPILRDRLWFFTAGRLQKQESGRTTVVTTIPYTFTEDVKRYEFKGTYAATANHRFQGAFTKTTRDQINYGFNQTTVIMDLRSLGTRKLPEDLFTVNYTGVLNRAVFVEGRYSNRDQSFIGAGAKSTDLIDGTLLIDRSRGNTRYWSDTFCGICDAERRDNSDLFAKGTYFLSSGTGSHTMTFGYDVFNDQRFANNHQSGSDYRIMGTSSIIVGTGESTVIYPQFLGDGTTVIQWNPIPLDSQGSNFRTHSFFYNDSWRAGDRLTANLGLRWDKNHGADQAGVVVARDSAFSPRLGVVWDLKGDGNWTVTGSIAKYVAAISNSIADASSAGGNPQTRQFVYRGANINPTGTTALVAPPDAIRAVFDWYNANGGPSLPLNGPPTIPGVTPQIRDSLASPSSWEYSTGLARQFSNRASARADFTFRNYQNLYVQRGDLSTGRVQDAEGRSYDLSVIENDEDSMLKRRYAGLTVSATYRLGTALDVGGNYTLSHAWGNVDGETINNGPIPFDFRYPEYKQASWNFPEGDLSVDQRHRSRLWINYSPAFVGGLTVSLLQAIESGVPYGAVSTSGVDPRPYVTNPGYLTPASGTQTWYFFTARDAFATEGQRRTDLAFNYTRRIPGASRLQLFGQLQILNVFNQFQLCACGASAFGTGSAANAGGVSTNRIDTTVLTPVTTARMVPFNPFTTTPVQGVNWDFGPNFGTALNRFAYTTPRSARASFGVRF